MGSIEPIEANLTLPLQSIYHKQSMADFVIQAPGRVEFEDGLRMEVLPEGCAGALLVTALSPGSIPIPSQGADWSWEWCSCHADPYQTKF